MTERKPMSKKLRFEVFKRDNFTCQYCGQMAPNVLLEVDHINPVKERGTNSIMNLVTSCRDCNRGKGAKTLTDNQVITQQQEQLKLISEKRKQLKMMLDWKLELEKFDEEQIDIIGNIIFEDTTKEASEYGRSLILKVIKKYGIDETIESAKIAKVQYTTTNKMFDYIPKICNSRVKQKKDPWLYKSYYIKGIIKNRFGLSNENKLMMVLTELVIDETTYKIVERIAKYSTSRYNFWDMLNDEFGTDY